MNPRLVKFVVEHQNVEKPKKESYDFNFKSILGNNFFNFLKEPAKVTVPVDKN